VTAGLNFPVVFEVFKELSFKLSFFSPILKNTVDWLSSKKTMERPRHDAR
jgi:hypothetical protein